MGQHFHGYLSGDHHSGQRQDRHRGAGRTVDGLGFQTIKFKDINKIWRTGHRARWLMIAPLGATLIVPLQWATFFGVVASFAVCAYRESEATTIVEVTTGESGVPIEQPASKVLPSNKVTQLNAYGSLFFAGARNLEEDLPQVDETHQAVVILSLRGHAELGSTFINVLERYAAALQKNGNTLMLINISPAVCERLEDTETLTILGAENVFVASKSGEAMQAAYHQAQQLIQSESTRPQSVTEQNDNPELEGA